MSVLAIPETAYELPLRPFTAEQVQRALDAGLFAPGQVALRGDRLIDCATGQAYLWSGQEYDRAIPIGVFEEGERAELIGGKVLLKEMQKPRHAYGISTVDAALRSIFNTGVYLRIQLPLTFEPDHRPEPDVAVVRGTFRDYLDAHPTTALLVVEIADATLLFDRGEKASMYAFAGIPDYWILNLPGRVLEVRRRPVADAAQQFGFGYEEVTTYKETGTVSPLTAPGSLIAVADLLP